jgi:ribosome maturation protein SDO1
MHRMTFDEERFSLNTAWIRKNGLHFEIVVDPDAAVAFKEKGTGDVHDIVKSKHVYTDAKRGDLASESLMKEVFGMTDGFAVAEKIIREGEIQLTKEFRDALRERKRRRVIMLILRNAIDPRTKLPIPQTRIELAMEEAKIKIEDFKSAEDQVQSVVRKLQPVLPIRFEHATLEIMLPAPHAAKAYGLLCQWGTVTNQSWNTDGSWVGEMDVPAGMVVDFIETLGSKTHGAASITNKTH